MAVRRTDPERRTRIADACLAVIARDGVAGTSHRKVAAAADVPLGSMTYHFSGMDDLLQTAFTRFVDSVSERFRERVAAADSVDAARTAVVTSITEDIFGDHAELVLTQELITLAARDPAFRRITDRWMAANRETLQRHFDPDTARILDAVIPGLALSRVLDPTTDVALVTTAIDRVTEATTG